VLSPTKTENADQPVKIADLFSKCSQLAAQEEKEMGRIVSTMLPVLAWLNEPVVLRPTSLGDAFQEFRSVTLETGAMVVMTDAKGRVSSKQLGEFRSEEYLAILEESFPELQRMAANKRRAGQVKPVLSLRIVLGGSRFVVDRRSYRLMVENKGGDCVGISVSARLPGGRTKSSRPCDVRRGQKAEVDLGVPKEVGDVEQLELQIYCKDVDGRELIGDESVRLDGASCQEAVLRRKN
jgi:hypothetical protein